MHWRIARIAQHVLRVGKQLPLVVHQQIQAHVRIVMQESTELTIVLLPQRVIPAISKSAAGLQLVLKGITFLQNVGARLVVIPVHAHLVLLGQIIQILTTKPNAHLSRHVVHR